MRRVTLATIGTAISLATILPFTALALWAEPSCDPADDPDSCNVSAPINVSNVSQTKSGALTITGALTANGTTMVNGTGMTVNAPLIINNTLSVGATYVSTFNGQVNILGAASSLTVGNKFTYSGTAANLMFTGAIEDDDVSDTLTSSIFKGTGSTTDAIDLASGEVAGTLPSSAVTDVWVNTAGDTMNGTLTINPSSGRAINIQPQAASVGIYIGGNTAQPLLSLQPAGTAANSEGIYINLVASSVAKGIEMISASTNYPLEVRATGTATRTINAENGAVGGYAVMGASTGATSIGVGGSGSTSGIFGTSTNGVGVVGSSDNYYGGSFQSKAAAGSGLYTTLSNTATTTSSKALEAVGKNGYGVYATTDGTASTAVYAGNTGNGGTGIEVNTEGIGLSITTNTTTASATGIVINAQGGQKGMEIDASATGIDVDTTSGYAMEANGDNIHTTGGYLGGQFYPGGNTSGELYANAVPSVVDTITMSNATGSDIDGLAFDGSDVWVGGGSHPSVLGSVAVQRINAYNGNLSSYYQPSSIGVGWFPGAIVYADDRMYIFSESAVTDQYLIIDLYDDTASSITSNLSTAIDARSAVYDGEDIWIGTDGEIYTLNGSTLTLQQSGLDEIEDILLADGYIWALQRQSSGDEVVYKIDRSTGSTVQTIDVGTDSEDMEFDGSSIWVANGSDTDRTLSRIDVTDETLTEAPAIVLNPIIPEADAITFDGVHLWIAGDDTLYGYNIAKEEVEYSITLNSTGYYDLIFDGQYVWASAGNTVDKVSVGRGKGYSMPTFPHGIILYGNDENFHCLYFDSSGNLQDSTGLSNCQ